MNIHEHQNPIGGGIEWNTATVIKDLSGPPNNWDSQTIETNVLEKYDEDHYNGTEWDPDSIMQYFYPDSWVKDGQGQTENQNLSDRDIQFLSQEMYPVSKEKQKELQQETIQQQQQQQKEQQHGIIQMEHTLDGGHLKTSWSKQTIALTVTLCVVFLVLIVVLSCCCCRHKKQ